MFKNNAWFYFIELSLCDTMTQWSLVSFTKDANIRIFMRIFAIRTVEELTSWFGLNESQMDSKLSDTQDNLNSQMRILFKFKEDISSQGDNKASLLAEGV